MTDATTLGSHRQLPELHYSMGTPTQRIDRAADGLELAKQDSEHAMVCPLSEAGVRPLKGAALAAGSCGDLVVEACPLADVLEERFRFERLLVDISASFVDLPLAETESRIEQSLQSLAEYLHVDRCSFAEFSDDKSDMIVRHCFVAPGIEPFPPVIVDGELPWYAEQIRKGAVLRFNRLPEDVPEEAVAERAYCARAGIKSHLAIPLKAGTAQNCVLTFATFREFRSWPNDLVERLRLVGQIFAASLARKRTEERLWELREQQSRMARLALVGELSAAIAHEINQPLCAIVTNAQAAQRILAKETPDLAEVRETLSDIAADSLRASAIVARVRGMVQKRATERSPLQIDRVIEDTVALINSYLVQARVRLSLEMQAEIPQVVADPIQIQQVLINLARNAIEAMSQTAEKSRELAIRARVDGKKQILVSLQDSGPGIEPKCAEAVFEQFYTTKTNGIGVGLSHSRSIIEAHGGRIWTESQPGHGATFHFTLPLATEAAS